MTGNASKPVDAPVSCCPQQGHESDIMSLMMSQRRRQGPIGDNWKFTCNKLGYGHMERCYRQFSGHLSVNTVHMLKGFRHEGKGQSQSNDLALNGTYDCT